MDTAPALLKLTHTSYNSGQTPMVGLRTGSQLLWEAGALLLYERRFLGPEQHFKCTDRIKHTLLGEASEAQLMGILLAGAGEPGMLQGSRRVEKHTSLCKHT